MDPCVLVSDFYAACKAGDTKQAKELQDYEVPPFIVMELDAAALGVSAAGMVEVVELLEDGAHQPYLDAVEESLRPPPEPVVKVSSDEEDDEKAPRRCAFVKFGTVNSIPSAKL